MCHVYILYSVQCTVYTVHCTLYSVWCIPVYVMSHYAYILITYMCYVCFKSYNKLPDDIPLTY